MSKRSLHKKPRSRALIVWKRWGDWRKLLIALVSGLFITALLTIQLLPDRVPVRAGDVAPADVFSPRYLQYEDWARTRELRQRIGAQVPPVYSIIAGTDAEVRQNVGDFFGLLSRFHQDHGVTREQHLSELQHRYVWLTPEMALHAVTLAPEQLGEAKQAALKLADDEIALAIPEDGLDAARVTVRTQAAKLSLPQPLREMDSVPTQYQTINRGDLVVRKGERITPAHLIKLTELGLIHRQLDVVTAVSLALLAFGLIAVFCLYLYQFHPNILREQHSLVLVAVVVCLSLLLFRVGSMALGLRFSNDQLGFLGMLCSSLGAMLLASLLCPQIAVFVGVALALLTSVMVGSELRFAILSIVSSLVGVQAVTTIRNRAGILRAVVVLSLVNALTAFVAHSATQRALPDDWVQTVIWALVGGVTAVGLWVLFAAWLERPFRVTTHLTLLELSDPSHPLLRRLAMEAPGTYAHSIIVGNLSEAAAEAIGADGLFCRVASYYHDIGKVVRPHFFVENQSSENRHEGINPSLSSLIVTSHVKDGVEMAEEHKLPPPIIAIIREHHGTCLIKYFYHRAVTTGTEESTPALEYQFRYDGPRPQTKESGIIMLADSTEAASRTLDKPTPGRIRDLIERIVRDRLADGQLDECELTFKDLEKIISSMTRSLTSLLHARVEYPSGDTAELKRLAADGAAYKESGGDRKALSDTPETAASTPVRLAGE